MKKIKLLASLAPITLIACAMPQLVGCASKEKTYGNLMSEFKPTRAQYEPEEAFVSYEAALDEYMNIISSQEDGAQIFEEDMLYTLSRGMPEYIAYISDLCEVTDQNFNADIHLNKDKSDFVNKLIVVDITFDSFYDYSETKREELIWYDMPAKVWNSKTEVELTLDFDTTDFNKLGTDSENCEAQRRQMTTLAGATQFGISEIGSTIQVLDENGYYIDVNDVKHTLPIGGEHVPTDILPFMTPQIGYWDYDQYTERLKKLYQVWYKCPGAQPLVILLRDYLPSNDLSNITWTPNSFDFGSYYMANISLEDTYAMSSDEKVCYGFNKSLNSINIMKNLELNEDYYDKDAKVMKLPNTTVEIRDYAFDSSKSIYTNFSIPLGINGLEIPESCKLIRPYAFAGSPQEGGFNTLTLNYGNVGGVLQIKEGAFSQLLGVDHIDLASFPVDYPTNAQGAWTNGFTNIHFGLIDQQIDGYINLPEGWDTAGTRDAWLSFLKDAGFSQICDAKNVEDPSQWFGWVVNVPQP